MPGDRVEILPFLFYSRGAFLASIPLHDMRRYISLLLWSGHLLATDGLDRTFDVFQSLDGGWSSCLKVAISRAPGNLPEFIASFDRSDRVCSACTAGRLIRSLGNNGRRLQGTSTRPFPDHDRQTSVDTEARSTVHALNKNARRLTNVSTCSLCRCP